MLDFADNLHICLLKTQDLYQYRATILDYVRMISSLLLPSVLHEFDRELERTSTHTIEVLRTIFARNGIPSRVVTDNGSQFTSSEFQQFMGLNGIKHIRTTPYHPSSNGLAERYTVQIWAHSGLK
jgi:transposase InsO family protein